MSLDNLEKILKHDNPKGNNLKEFVGIVSDVEEINSVEEKRNAYECY